MKYVKCKNLIRKGAYDQNVSNALPAKCNQQFERIMLC
jgi:hypothetical protein